MQLSKGMIVITVIVPLLAGLSGCASSLMEVSKGSDQVSLANANQVSGCQSKGGIIVSVFAKGGIVSRFPEDVEDNLLQLARNNAVDAGADTVLKGESLEFGKRTFEMYKCRP